MKKMQRTEEKIRIAQWHLEVLNEGACSDEADSLCHENKLDGYVDRRRMQDEVWDSKRKDGDIRKWTEEEAQGYLTGYADGCKDDPSVPADENTEEFAWRCIEGDYKNRWCGRGKRGREVVKIDKQEKIQKAGKVRKKSCKRKK